MPTVSLKLLARTAAAIAATAGFAYALYIVVDLADVVTRPANQSWVDALVIFLTPVFFGVALLLIASALLARYAWAGSFLGKWKASGAPPPG